MRCERKVMPFEHGEDMWMCMGHGYEMLGFVAGSLCTLGSGVVLRGEALHYVVDDATRSRWSGDDLETVGME